MPILRTARGTCVLLLAAAAAGCGGDPQWSDPRADRADAGATVPRSRPTPSPTAARAATGEGATASPVRGVVKAKSEATIASRFTARITAMPFKTGAAFGRGALLARFDCSQAEAQLRAARAAAAAYRTTYDTNVELDQYKAIGKNEVAVAQANLGKANAEASAIAAQLTDCAIHAPFAGKVVEQIAHAREVAASGQPLMRIQSGGALEVDLIVPSDWLVWLRPGARFAFRVDETGETVNGVVTRLGAAVDPVSKTIRITGDLTGAKGIILPGMSGGATFAHAAESAKHPEAPSAAISTANVD